MSSNLLCVESIHDALPTPFRVLSRPARACGRFSANLEPIRQRCERFFRNCLTIHLCLFSQSLLLKVTLSERNAKLTRLHFTQKRLSKIKTLDRRSGYLQGAKQHLQVLFLERLKTGVVPPFQAKFSVIKCSDCTTVDTLCLGVVRGPSLDGGN